MSSEKVLINTRKYLRSLVTKNYNERESFGILDSRSVDSLKLSFDSWLKELKELNTQILQLRFEGWDETECEVKASDELKTCHSYNDKIYTCLSILNDISRQKSVGSPNVDIDSQRSLLKHPVAPLPKYAGTEDEDIERFFREFEETTNKYKYSQYDLLLLLKQQISGRALILLNSLEADKQGYKDGKGLLLEAFASKKNRKFSVVKQLTNMKLDIKTDPFEYVSRIRLLTESVKKLEIDTDFFLNYFFWEGLNNDFKSQLILITNSYRPSLKEINDNFFEASERYLNQIKKRKDFSKADEKPEVSSNSVSMAASVNFDKSNNFDKPNNFVPCSICSQLDGKVADHPMFKCVKFKSPSEKIDKLKSLKGCLKCTRLNHSANVCKFRFRTKCKNCSSWHFSFLCSKQINDNKVQNNKSNKVSEKDTKVESKSKNENSTVNLTAVVEAFQGSIDSQSVLPTFSSKIHDKDIRALKDGGCQFNFLSESIAKELNLKVINNDVSISLKGINGLQHYKMNLVEVPLNIDDNIKLIPALCHNIDIALKLPGLGSIVTGFKNKGYHFADKNLHFLSDTIDDISLIIGTKSGYCLPDREYLFGCNNESLFSMTPIGVMLKGDINQLLCDISYLPYSNEVKFVNSNDFLVSDEFIKPIINNNNEISTSLISVLDSSKFGDEDLERATAEILEVQCKNYLNVDESVDSASTEINDKLVQYALSNMTLSNNRIVVPILWNGNVAHLLGRNFNLSLAILKSNLTKLTKDPIKLEMMDNVFKDQEKSGIIVKIDNIEQYMGEHPECSFMPHMGVFKMNRESTKCRVVYLSNLCENNPDLPMTVSHNQAIHPGPSLNQKITTTILHLRFGKHLLCFDIVKAFNQLSLNDTDSNRLLALWFKDVKNKDFSIVAYKNVRLSFGLRCSPTLLLLSIYKILILDAEQDEGRLKYLKKQIYQLCYMDNLALAYDDLEEFNWAFSQLVEVFDKYSFKLQQFCTNYKILQNHIDSFNDLQTPVCVKLLGLQWNRENDTLFTQPINLDINACTKRQILSSIASQYDIFNFNGPILNRGRLFLHKLQCDKVCDWDQTLDHENLKEWRNIVRQSNSAPVNEIKRFVGSKSDNYKLIAYSDSSKLICGAVIYIQNLITNELSFLMARNKIIGKDLVSKSIPTLELQGIAFAAELLIDTYKELAGPACIDPVRIVNLQVFTDSLVCVSWIKSYNYKLDKMQHKSVFLMNRLLKIQKVCEIHPITFSFIAGSDNPGDCITRSLSPKQLAKSNYFKGPIHKDNLESVDLSVTLPMPFSIPDFRDQNLFNVNTVIIDDYLSEHKSLLDHSSSFKKVILAYTGVLKFIDKLKSRVKIKNPNLFSDFSVNDQGNYCEKACILALKRDQKTNFPDIFDYFSNLRNNKSMPNLVSQLNVFLCKDGLLRVSSKMARLNDSKDRKFPILLSRESILTKLIILDIHFKLNHSGCYSVVKELRNRFWLPKAFSSVKKVLKNCILCRRLNNRTIKLNQSPYREFRVNPPEIPYRYIFMDYIGPFNVKQGNAKVKVYVLCITCTWCRAINLKLCIDLTVKEFLRAFQLHCFDYGVPEYCVTDMGSQLLAGANIITDYIKDPETQRYFEEQGIKPLKFDHFFKGCSALGGMVESCVKITKRLIFGSIKNIILPLRDFEFILNQTIHIANKRPIAFKETLRDSNFNEVPDIISPESLIRGYHLFSINIIPQFHEISDDLSWDPDTQPCDRVKNNFEKMQKVRKNLKDLYHSQFICTLIDQATDVKERYKPVNHYTINKGDVVLLREEFTKPSCYPMGIVIDTLKNVNDEITGAIIRKGKNRELVKRHISTVIPLLSDSEYKSEPEDNFNNIDSNSTVASSRIKRAAAIKSTELTKALLNDD